MERLCETTPHGGGAIFAPLKLLDKRGDRRSAEVMGGATASPATCILHPLSGVSSCRRRLLGAHFDRQMVRTARGASFPYLHNELTCFLYPSLPLKCVIPEQSMGWGPARWQPMTGSQPWSEVRVRWCGDRRSRGRSSLSTRRRKALLPASSLRCPAWSAPLICTITRSVRSAASKVSRARRPRSVSVSPVRAGWVTVSQPSIFPSPSRTFSAAMMTEGSRSCGRGLLTPLSHTMS